MSWVPPFFTCGECGGEIGRWPMKNMLKQDILDWRHRTVPTGVTEHRAVLGTPVPLAEVKLASTEPDEEVEPDVAPEPIVPARPAMRKELPASALRLDSKAAANGWTVQAFYMHGPLMTAAWKFNRMVESVVLWLDRDGHRLVASWQNDTPGVRGWTASGWPGVPFVPSLSPWSFNLGYSLTHTADPVGSPELNKLVTAPRAVCESCGEPPALHVDNGGPICHAEWQENRTKEDT